MKSYHWIILLLAAALVAVACRLAISEKSAESAQEDSSENAALECIMTRTSVRAYEDKAVPDSIIEKILRAGMAAPTAANQQAWELVVVTQQALKDSISSQFKFAKMVEKAPFAVVVCGNMDLLFKGDRQDGGMWVQDASAVSENMLLAAHALGLGGVWCGVYPEEDREAKMSEILNLPSNLRPLNVMAFGYPLGKPQPKDKWDPNKVHYNAY